MIKSPTINDTSVNIRTIEPKQPLLFDVWFIVFKACGVVLWVAVYKINSFFTLYSRMYWMASITALSDLTLDIGSSSVPP